MQQQSHMRSNQGGPSSPLQLHCSVCLPSGTGIINAQVQTEPTPPQPSLEFVCACVLEAVPRLRLQYTSTQAL